MIINFKYLGQTGGGSSSGGGMTSGDVQTIVESYNYVNSGQVETQIESKHYVTEEDIPDSTILKSVEELNSGASIGDIQTKTNPDGEKVNTWNLEGSEGAELTITSIPESWTDPTEHNIGQIRDKQVLGYGDDNWVTLYAYYNTTTNEPMIRVATEHSIEEYTLDEFGASSEGDELATFIDPENTAHTCTINVLAHAGAYVFSVNTDEGYNPNLIYDTTEFYDGFAFDGVYAKTSVSGYTKLATVEDIPDVSAFITSADTQNFLTSADTQNFLTSADTQGFVSTADYVEDAEVISTALNDLNTRMSGVVVSDGSVSRIVKVTQSAYDEMASAGTIDDNTVYYIVADPASGSTGETTFDAATYCTGELNGSWDGEVCEFTHANEGEEGTSTEQYDETTLQRKWECEQNEGHWNYDTQCCDGDLECDCMNNGGTWIPDPESSEGGECQYPEDEGGEA